MNKSGILRLSFRTYRKLILFVSSFKIDVEICPLNLINMRFLVISTVIYIPSFSIVNYLFLALKKFYFFLL